VNNITVNRKRINYQFYNLNYMDKEVCLVFLHDGLGSLKQWNDFPCKISSELKIPAFVYDRVGHGESDDLIMRRSKNFFHREAENLNRLLNKLQINCNLFLIGSSDGGTIALVYSVLFPENVKGIVTIAAHTFVEEKTISGILELKEKYTKYSVGNYLKKFHGEKTDTLFKSWTNLWLSRKFREWNIFKDLKKVKCDVLALQGDNDEYGTKAQLKSIKENVKGRCTIKLVKDANHFPHIKKEEEVFVLIKKFIDNKITGFNKRSSSVRY